MAAFTTSEWELSRLQGESTNGVRPSNPETTPPTNNLEIRPDPICQDFISGQLYALLQPDDVVVADSAYGTYVDLTLVHSANADALRVRQSPTEGDPPSGLDSPCFVNIMRVTVIFAPCKKLGIGDHIVRWQRPQRCPTSMSPEDFAALPASIEVREVHLLIQQPFFSSQGNHFGHHLT